MVIQGKLFAYFRSPTEASHIISVQMLTVACHGALQQKTMKKIVNGENALDRSCKKLVALISEQVS